ncbi:MAG: hypothetical protein ACAI37_24885 [Chthoniobacter sp.]
MAAMVVVVLGLPTLFAFGPTPKAPFDDEPVRTLSREHPQIVLIGDSMLESRIDPQILTRLSGQRCSVVSRGGSSSATWYLMMKNLVIVQKHLPQTVIIPYRNRQLTLPAHRTAGSYRKALEPFMREAEPLLEKLIAPVGKETPKTMAGLVQTIYPMDRRRDMARETMQAWALDLIASSREYQGIRSAAKRLFRTQNLRLGSTVDETGEGMLSSLDADDHIFADHVERSFLPHMVAMAREAGIEIIFYKIKRRPRPDGTQGEESPTMGEYDRALRAYLEQAGVRLYDESHQDDVVLDFYGSGDHVAEAMVPRYSELFWRNVGPLVNREAAR